jgi:hypothetical protein
MNKKTGLYLLVIILTVILAACTAQSVPTPPTATPTALPLTPTALPPATARPTAVPTMTPTPLFPDAQALKDIEFTDCIPVDDALPKGMEISWNLLVMQDGDLYILNFEADTKIKVPDFNERMNRLLFSCFSRWKMVGLSRYFWIKTNC